MTVPKRKSPPEPAPRGRGRPTKAPEDAREAISFRFPPGTKAKIRRSMALLTLASPDDAPTDLTSWVMAAIDEKIARDSARKPAK